MIDNTAGSCVLTKVFTDIRRSGWGGFLALSLMMLYVGIAWLARGENEWWYIDFVAGTNVYWGDDAYRFFLARTAWLNPDAYWFNFVLPGALILDGLVATLSNGHVFYAHAIKSLPLTASIILVYFTCIRLEVSRLWAIVASVVLGLTPIYVLVSLSFYGESWFVFLASFALFLLASNRVLAAALVIGVMPLFRLEGLAFAISFAILGLRDRSWRASIAVFVPGVIYFLMIIALGPGLTTFVGWRFEITEVYKALGIWYGGELSRVFDAFYWPWLLAAVAALCLKEARPILIMLIGSVIVALQVILSSRFERSALEPRLLVVIFPVIAVGLALALQKQEAMLKQRRRALLVCTSIVFIGLILFSHISSIHVFSQLRQYVIANGRLPLEVLDNPFKMETYFKKAGAEKVAGYREYAEVAMQMISQNLAIETLMVSDPHVLYYLDPKRLPDNVDVVFALFGWPTLDPVLDGSVTSGYFPHPPFSAYYLLERPKAGSRLLLYLDDMGIEGYPYHWVVKGNNIYLFSATKVQTSGITPFPKK